MTDAERGASQIHTVHSGVCILLSTIEASEVTEKCFHSETEVQFSPLDENTIARTYPSVSFGGHRKSR